MIDVDGLEEQLEQALAANLGLAPAPEPAPPPFSARSPSLEGDQRAQNDQVMQALLEGRVHDARRGLDDALRVGRHAADPEARSRHLTQQFWLVLEWGDEDEQYALLDECRARAYTHGELPWLGALTLLLAHLERRDEASRELEAAIAECQSLPPSPCRLDILTNLAEAAFLLGDATRAALLRKWFATVPEQLVIVGGGAVCKGMLRRYRAQVAAVLGGWDEADKGFRAAVDAHRALGARPLLARTLRQWGGTLAGRDDLLARRCLQQSEELAAELGRAAGVAVPATESAASTPA